MGFDWQKLRLLSDSFCMREMDFVPFAAETIRAVSNHAPWNGTLEQLDDLFDFRPHFGWAGAIENKRRMLAS